MNGALPLAIPDWAFGAPQDCFDVFPASGRTRRLNPDIGERAAGVQGRLDVLEAGGAVHVGRAVLWPIHASGTLDRPIAWKYRVVTPDCKPTAQIILINSI